MVAVRRTWLFSVLAVSLASALPGVAEGQGRLPAVGNSGMFNTEVSRYRAHVHNLVASLIEDLGHLWNDSNPAKPLAFYSPNATVVLGPADVIQGRDDIRRAFSGRLGEMQAVRFTLQDFDMSDEIVFIRGTMGYELNLENGASSVETAAFTMLLRMRRDEWLIQSLTIAGPPPLKGRPPA